MNYYLVVLILCFIISFILFRKRLIAFKSQDILCDLKLIKHQNEIIPNLWLGDSKSSVDKQFLETNNIKLIINLSKTLPFTDIDNIQKHRISINDNRSKESNIGMITQFEDAYELINENLKSNNGILIHCRAGCQRSATLVALYLMKNRHINSQKAKNFIKSKRCITFFPYPNFEPVLRYYDAFFGII